MAMTVDLVREGQLTAQPELSGLAELEHDEHVRRVGYYATSIKERLDDDGLVYTETCVDCGLVLPEICAHQKCTWNEAGTVISCKKCGLDCT